MHRTRKTITAAILFLASSLWNAADSTAVTPAGQLQETWQQIVLVLKSARFDSEPEIDAFKIKVTQVVAPRFDFDEMAKRCLGAHWTNLTGEAREQYVKLFVAMLTRSYVGGIREYKDSTVLYTRESNDANNAEVDTKVLASGAKDLLVTYRMHLVDENWKVYDVIIDHVSLIDNYRAQFQRVIAQSSFEGLIRIMKERQS